MTRAMAREMAAAQARSRQLPRTPSRPSPRMQASRRWIKRYRPADTAHRHRIEDDQPKSERVTSYVRRT